MLRQRWAWLGSVKAKSVVLTEAGLREAERLFQVLFARRGA
jgi:hypothetical protein